MRNYEFIVSELEARGHKCKVMERYKNGRKVKALVGMKDRASPVLYPDDMSGTDEHIVEVIADVFSNPIPDIADTEELVSRFSESVRVRIQRESGDEVAKRRVSYMPGIEEIMVYEVTMSDGTKGSFKVTDEFLEHVEIDIDGAWEIGERNTFAESTMFDVGSVTGIYGSMNVVSNHSGHYGASAVLNTVLIEKFAKDHRTNEVIIIPSSIHECLLVSANDMPIEVVDAMVADVNAHTVAAEEVLYDRAFVVDVTKL